MTQHTEPEANQTVAIVTARILRDVDAAVYLGVSPITLRQWRVRLVGPKFIRLGSRAIGYRVADLDSWIDSRAVKTSAV